MNILKPNRLLIVLVILTLLISTLPITSVHAETLVPTPKKPSGVITDNTPLYAWSRITTATKYALELYRGSTRVYIKYPSKLFCLDKFTCQYTPKEILPYGVYQWRIRANVAGVWKAWSSYREFEVSRPAASFTSAFDGSMTDWSRFGGGTWNTAATYIYTEGANDAWSSIYRSTSSAFRNFDYKVRMKREDTDGTPANCLAFRMGTRLLAANDWVPGYKFCYYDDSTFVVLRKNSAGSMSILHYYEGTLAIDPGGWNVLRVYAVGDRFNFYINNTWVAEVIDPTFTIGRVGISMYKVGSHENTLKVDYARLNVIP